MKPLALVPLLLAACASVPRGSTTPADRAVYEGYTADEVRGAAVATLNDLSRFISPARVTEDGRVVSEYAASGWTSFEVRFDELDGAVAAKVSIEKKPQHACSTGRLPRRAQVHVARVPVESGADGSDGVSALRLPRVAFERECTFETKGGRVEREREILDEIRVRLESGREADESIVAEVR